MISMAWSMLDTAASVGNLLPRLPEMLAGATAATTRMAERSTLEFPDLRSRCLSALTPPRRPDAAAAP
jgi:hypothetical protein